MKPRARKTGAVLALVGAWFFAVVAGMLLLMLDSFEPGDPATAPTSWPTGSGLRRAADRPTLVLVAHPHCTCTRATLAELGELMPRLRDQVVAHVLFAMPGGDLEAARAGSLWRQAEAIAGVEITADVDGREADLFGSQTSGQAYLFLADGTLAFSGGITPARGEQGDNVGRRSLLALARGEPIDVAVGNVFGCALRDAAATRFWWPELRPAAIVGGTHPDGSRDEHVR